jgi:hypothetical protein
MHNFDSKEMQESSVSSTRWLLSATDVHHIRLGKLINALNIPNFENLSTHFLVDSRLRTE